MNIDSWMIYARGLSDMSDWDMDFKRESYIKAVRGKGKCKGRHKKQNMLHVKRAAKLRRRKAR